VLLEDITHILSINFFFLRLSKRRKKRIRNSLLSISSNQILEISNNHIHIQIEKLKLKEKEEK